MTTPRSEHTPDCRAVRGDKEVDPWPLMGNLSLVDQQAVLDCPHPSHDVVRQLWMWEAP